MSRIRKLLIVSVVLATGIALAWPFRKQANQRPLLAPASVDLLTGVTRDVPPPAAGASRHVAAKMASTGDSAASDPHRRSPRGFDVAHHPAVANQTLASTQPPVTPPIPPPLRPRRDRPAARPAYATIEQGLHAGADAEWPGEVIHVVQNGDTLDKLAKRYLRDPGRALEIFQLNRDRLTNPHLLPIDAELRIPVVPGQTFD